MVDFGDEMKNLEQTAKDKGWDQKARDKAEEEIKNRMHRGNQNQDEANDQD